MIAPKTGPIKAPREHGFMSANMVLPLYEVLERDHSVEMRDDLFQRAGMRYLPTPEEPVREKQVMDLHQAIRQTYPDDWPDVMHKAGQLAGHIILNYRLDGKARRLLKRLPWPLATWMLVRTTAQNSWAFSGSGDFKLLKTSSFELVDNPVTRNETAQSPVCVFQQTMLETVFCQAIHPMMRCTETQCCATGASSCRFELAMTPAAVGLS